MPSKRDARELSYPHGRLPFRHPALGHHCQRNAISGSQTGACRLANLESSTAACETRSWRSQLRRRERACQQSGTAPPKAASRPTALYWMTHSNTRAYHLCIQRTSSPTRSEQQASSRSAELLEQAKCYAGDHKERHWSWPVRQPGPRQRKPREEERFLRRAQLANRRRPLTQPVSRHHMQRGCEMVLSRAHVATRVLGRQGTGTSAT